MLKTLGRMTRKLIRHDSGNASMLVAIAMPALIGAAGLAVDMTQWYAWKRELQHAVDQAAIGAAWALTDPATSSTYQTRGNQEFLANIDKTASFKTNPTYTLANYSNGTNNSVIATATASKSLPFSSFLTQSGVTIRATAQASFAAGGEYNACLISLGDSGTTMDIGGNANVIARCGMAALSCSDDAVTIDGSATVVVDSIVSCGTASVPTANESAVTQVADGVLVDDYEYLDRTTDTSTKLSPPDNPTPRTVNCVGNGNRAIASLSPGTYTGGLVTRCSTVLAKGIYVINGGSLDLTGNYSVSGTNVIFVLKGGATIKLGGSGNGNILTLTPMQASDYTALGYSTALANKYANMLVFEDRNNNPSQDHIINGNSNSLIQGTIYLPDGNVRVNGTADIDSSCLQISALTISVIGNATLNTRCTTEQSTSVGTGAAGVRLVA